MLKVSVIVPIYNIPEVPLRECIESLQNSSYHNIEILLVNDGSTTNCKEVCMEYAADSRIHLIHKPNGGVSSARNLGIKEAKGDYLMFVDADDMITSNAIEILVKEASFNNTDIMVCNYKRFYKYNDRLCNSYTKYNISIFERFSDLIKLRKKCLIEDDSLGVTFNGAPWGKLYSSKLMRDSNIKFNESLIRSQDNYFNFIAFGLAKKIGYVNAPLYLYRYLPSSSVNRFRRNLFEISQNYLSIVQQCVEEEDNMMAFSETISYVKLEKFSEYISTWFAHTQNKLPLNQKILELKDVKNKWLEEDEYVLLRKRNYSLRSKIFNTLILKKRYRFLYYYIRLLNRLKSWIIKLYVTL